MARTPDGNTPRTEVVTFRTTPDGLRMLNHATTEANRSAYMRNLIQADCARRRLTLPKEIR